MIPPACKTFKENLQTVSSISAIMQKQTEPSIIFTGVTEVIMEILRLLLAMVAAYLVGRLAAKLRLPAILGWLVAGMVLGPHALGLINDALLDAKWYNVTESVLECTVGLMIGSELIWKRMKSSGKQIIVTTITESLGAFVCVSAVFGVIFALTDVPVYLAFMFGGIALATAPAPSLSIVTDMKTAGPVTSTLIPLAVLDDLVAALVFFLVVAGVTAAISTAGVSVAGVMFLVFLPVLIGAATGAIAGALLRRVRGKAASLAVMLATLLGTAALGLWLNSSVLPMPTLNFLLLGMAYSTVFANMIEQKQLDDIMSVMNPVIGVCMIVIILNLGAPLDYHLVLGAGVYTAVYIITRAIGKYGGARIGASLTHAPDTVRKYLGFTLLPHSGVSLMFTGIAVSVLEGPAPECARIVQGTIAAAAVINEIIAVILAKKGFEWAGELGKAAEGRKELEAERETGAQPRADT